VQASDGSKGSYRNMIQTAYPEKYKQAAVRD
jgi:hypothetical protein